MGASIVEVLGGIGLFLLGMLTMTDGLRSVAGSGLESVLRRMTHSPTSGAATGALMTALIQSSSATTVMAVGFAGAGLLSFAEALGIVFGANLGTTMTGWMIALLGIKLQLSSAAPVLVFIGVSLLLVAHGSLRRFGRVLAGFGLIFLGLGVLQSGMAGFEGFVTPESLPENSWSGRLQLLVFGILFTLVTQSSSAGVVFAIVGLDSGVIELPQAAAMVVGMDVGTTATTALATIGASLPARRTGWAHVVFNCMTGVAAFLVVPLYSGQVSMHWPSLVASSPELALVAFHTLFNLVGVLAVLPVASPFARLMERLIPDRPSPFTRRLDRKLLSEPAVAIRALAPTLSDLAQKTFATAHGQLAGNLADSEARIDLLELAVSETQAYLASLSLPFGQEDRSDHLAEAARNRLASALHCIDQLHRLHSRMRQQSRIGVLRRDLDLVTQRDSLVSALADVSSVTAEARSPEAIHALAASLAEGRQRARAHVLALASSGFVEPADALARLDALRWSERVAHHASRILYHLAVLEQTAAESQEA